MPFGNRCFLDKHEEQIRIACETFKKKNIILKNDNAIEILNNTEFNFDDYIYLDPPYTNTTAIYNEQRAFGGWTIENDYELFDILEKLNKKGIKWGLSNVFENKRIKNQHLIDWCNKNRWNVTHLNCNYASLGKGSSNTDEVFICNYSTNMKIMNKINEIKVVSYNTNFMFNLEEFYEQEPELFKELVNDYPIKEESKIIITVKEGV